MISLVVGELADPVCITYIEDCVVEIFIVRGVLHNVDGVACLEVVEECLHALALHCIKHEHQCVIIPGLLCVEFHKSDDDSCVVCVG